MAEPQDWFAANAPNATAPPTALLGRAPSSGGEGEAPSALSTWFETQLRPALESAAHPHSLDDIGHLLMADVDATRGFATGLIAKAAEKVGEARASVRDVADAAIEHVVGSPEQRQLAATRMKLQAARSVTRQGRIAQDIADMQAPTADAPAATPPATAAPVAAPPASPAAAAPGPSGLPDVPPEVGKILKQMLDAGMTTNEVSQAYQLLRKGMPVEKVMTQLEAVRKLQGLPSFRSAMTDAQREAAVANRNATGRWPE